MRVLVTGESAFIGSHVEHHLAASGHILFRAPRRASRYPGLIERRARHKVLGSYYTLEASTCCPESGFFHTSQLCVRVQDGPSDQGCTRAGNALSASVDSYTQASEGSGSVRPASRSACSHEVSRMVELTGGVMPRRSARRWETPDVAPLHRLLLAENK